MREGGGGKGNRRQLRVESGKKEVLHGKSPGKIARVWDPSFPIRGKKLPQPQSRA